MKKIVPFLLCLVLLLSLVPVSFVFADTQADAQILQNRREQVFGAMWDMATVMWRATEDINYAFGASNVTIKAGRLYRGIPYTHARGTYASFAEYLDAPNEKGEYNLVGLNPEAFSGSSQNARLGNDCSGAATAAYGSISPTIRQAGASTQAPVNGYLRVALDKYIVKPSDTTNSDGKTVCADNGEQVMYAIYAEAQLADLWVCSGHTMMNRRVEVVYKDDGTIDGEKSKSIIVHQTPEPIRNNEYYGSGEFSEANYGEKVYKTFGVDVTRTFKQLYDSGYMPVTCKELVDPSPIPVSTVSDSESNHSFATIFSGTLSSNYLIDSVTVTIADANGNPLQKGTARAIRSDGTTNTNMVYDLSRLRYESPEKMNGSINLNLLGAGNYHCQVDVHLFNGDLHKKVRDFDFTVTEDDLCEGWVDNSSISEKFAVGTKKAACPVCGGNAVTWNALPAAGSAVTLAPGHYYVENDITNSSYYTITGGSICVHLNDHDITSTHRVFDIAANGTLNMMGNGMVMGAYTSTDAAGSDMASTIRMAAPTANAHFYGGTYGHKYGTTYATLRMEAPSGTPTAKMYGGATFCRTDGAYGANIMVRRGNFEMYGGLITDGYHYTGSATYGGNVRVTTNSSTSTSIVATFTMHDGVISDGIATYGGNVYVDGKKGSFIMHGGTIYRGVAGYRGESGAGGNIYVTMAGSVQLDGHVLYGKAYSGGGNIYGKSKAVIRVGGVVEKGNGGVNSSARQPGANIYITASGTTLTVTGTVRDNLIEATNGGNIYADTKAAVTIDGGTVSGGKASSSGGNISIEGGSSLTINSGKIINGNASTGGNIWCAESGSSITMSGGEISGGVATNNDNVRLNKLATMTMTGGTVYGTNGSSTTAGNAITANNATIRLGGDAKVLRPDGNWTGLIQIPNSCGKLHIIDGWTGEAGVHFSDVSKTAHGTMIPQHDENYNYASAAADKNLGVLGRCVTYNTSTKKYEAGGTYTGKLHFPYATGTPLILTKNATDGNLWVAGTQVVGQAATWVVDNEAAVNTVEDGQYIKLFTNNTLTLTKDAYVDINGHNVTISGSGNLYGMDCSNDDYQGNGTVAVTGNVESVASNPVSGNRYVSVVNDGQATFHRLDMVLSAVSLRTSAAGLYYKAKLYCDDVLAPLVGDYGIVLSVDNMPGADFKTEQADINSYTVCSDSFVSGAEITSGSVFGIMKESRETKVNAAYGDVKIYANAYVTLPDGTVLMSDGTVNDTIEAANFDGVAWSLHDAMNALDKMFPKLQSEVQRQLNAFYTRWYEDGMGDWRFENICVTGEVVE